MTSYNSRLHPPPLLQIGVLASVCAPSAGKNIVYSYTPTHTHTPTHTPTNIHTATPTSIASLLQTDGKYRSTIVRTPCPPDRRIGVPCPVTPPRTCVPCPTNRRSGGGRCRSHVQEYNPTQRVQHRKCTNIHCTIALD